MGFVPFNNVIKLEAVYSWASQTVENVHFYIVDETPNVETAQQLCAAYITDWTTGLRAQISTTASLILLRATIMENQNDPGIEYSVGLPLAGTATGQSMPNNVTVAVKWSTAFRGRSYRGRTYHIGLTEAQIDGSTLIPASRTLIEAGWAGMMSLAVNVGPAIMCVASRVSNGVERTVGIATPILDVSVDSYVDSQRRRLPGRGR